MCYCRPDTTWERENRDFYSPESIDEILWSPVMFARIGKSGKCIGDKFAGRYYDAFNFGVLLYTGKGDIAFTSCADHSSILPSPLYNNVVMDNEQNRYEVNTGRGIAYSCNCDKKALEDAICKASRLTSLRTGDYVAIELAPMKTIAIRDDETASLKGTFCENDLFDLKIIF